MRWSFATGMQALDGITPSFFSNARAVSVNGEVIVGEVEPGNFREAFR